MEEEVEARRSLDGEGAVPGPPSGDRTPGAAPDTPARPRRVDRRAAFAAGPPPFPKKVLYAFVGVLVLAVLLVTVVDHFIGSGSSTTAVPSSTRTTASTTPTDAGVGGVSAPTGAARLHASLAALLGLKSLHSRPAPAWTLTDPATGTRVALRSLHGRVVVLTFADGDCQDICPVLASEIAKASSRLAGRTAAPVTFVTVNTDPLLRADARPPILDEPGLRSLSHWRYVSGSVRQLDPVWKAYGISITVDDATHLVTHNNLMYFISPTGRLTWSATPFADESTNGVFSLGAPVVSRFAKGIATYAARLAGTP